jgi:UMF1 family MFS transporter
MDKKVFSWCLFDFANSSYSAVIAAVIFPVYYTNTIVGNTLNEGDLWWGRAIALSMAFVALTSPFLGGIADYAKKRKRFLMIYTLLCIVMTASLYFLKKGMVIEGFFMIILANIGLEGGLVFYNAFLNDITDTTHQGRVSAWGYGIGYAGSIISLLVGLLLVKAGHIDLIWPMVAVFFGIFSLPAFLFLPGDEKGHVSPCKAGIDGFRSTITTFRRLLENREQRRFLLAYLVYEDGVNTVIVFSSIFAATTLFFKPEELIGIYLIIQATALAGAFVMARFIDYWGPKRVVMLSLILWILTATTVYFIQTKAQFMVVASVAGLGLGTVQAATRAFYAQFIPEGSESEYFGVYSLVGKSSAIIGPLLFGFISSTFRNQRPAVLSISLLFLAGLVIIRTVKGGGPNVTSAKS